MGYLEDVRYIAAFGVNDIGIGDAGDLEARSVEIDHAGGRVTVDVVDRLIGDLCTLVVRQGDGECACRFR